MVMIVGRWTTVSGGAALMKNVDSRCQRLNRLRENAVETRNIDPQPLGAVVEKRYAASVWPRTRRRGYVCVGRSPPNP